MIDTVIDTVTDPRYSAWYMVNGWRILDRLTNSVILSITLDGHETWKHDTRDIADMTVNALNRYATNEPVKKGPAPLAGSPSPEVLGQVMDALLGSKPRKAKKK